MYRPGPVKTQPLSKFLVNTGFRLEMVFRVLGVLISLSSARQRVSLQTSLLNLKIPR